MKLYIGGSPCTHWSIAQTQNRETQPSGLGWELFLNYVIGLNKFNPDYFLYENNKSMSPAIREQITKELGVEPILINSALVSAQNRQRLYWTNIPGVTQPEDRGILLRDILESGADLSQNEKAYCLTSTYFKGPAPENTLERCQRTMDAEPVIFQTPRGYNKGGIKYEKAPTLTANGKWQDNNHVVEPIRIGTIENKLQNPDHDSKQYRVYSPEGKATTLCGQGGGVGAKTGLYAVPINIEWLDGKTYLVYEVRDGLITIKDKRYPIKLADGFYIIRKLTVTECKRLQTVPDSYVFPVSNSQAYKMLGNGWTVEVIKHILSFIPCLSNQEFKVLSMYDGMSAGMIALQGLGANVASYHATEIDKYAVQTTQHNYPDTVQLGDAFQVREMGWAI